VNAGLTACPRFPALAAVKVRMDRNALQPASAILLASAWCCTMLRTRKSSGEIVSYWRTKASAVCLVVEVAPLLAEVLLRLGAQHDGLASSAAAALLAPRHPALAAP
jgi:hypothetical protein